MAEGFLLKVRAGRESDLRLRMKACPLRGMEARARQAPPPRPFAGALRERRPAVIAEIKRRSPSAGLIREVRDPAALAVALAGAGAACLSVLTESGNFGGSLRDLELVTRAVAVPVLRKDFLVYPWELYETRAAGADAALLIAALLGGGCLEEMMAAAADAGLEALVEVRNEAELERAVKAGARLIGVNNRDLATLRVDTNTALRLGPLIPPGVTAVAESGYSDPAAMAEAMRSGFGAFLVGGALMAGPDPAAALRRLLGDG